MNKLTNFSRVNDIASDVNDFFTFSGSGRKRDDSDPHDSRVTLRILSFQFLPIELASSCATVTNPFCSNWRIRVELVNHENNDVFDSFLFDVNGSLFQSNSDIPNFAFPGNSNVKPCRVVLSQLQSSFETNDPLATFSLVNGSATSTSTTTTVTTNVTASHLFDMVFEERLALSSSTTLSPRREICCALSYTFPFPHFLVDNLYFRIFIHTVEKPTKKQQQELNGVDVIETLVAQCKTDVISTMHQPLMSTFVNKKIRIRTNQGKRSEKSSQKVEQKPRCNIQVKVEKFV